MLSRSSRLLLLPSWATDAADAFAADGIVTHQSCQHILQWQRPKPRDLTLLLLLSQTHVIPCIAKQCEECRPT
jgi:hypothetical protein